MMSSPDRYPNPNDYADPLENYDSPKYEDPLERALAEKSVEEIEIQPFTAVEPTTSVEEVIKTMAARDISCVLVAKDERLVGIFSERDVLDKVAENFDEARERPVKEFMSADPIYVYRSEAAASAVCVMAIAGYRHVPVLGSNDQILGIVGPRRATWFLRKYLGDTPK